MPLVCKRYSPLPSIPTPQKADLVMSLRSSWPGFNHPHMNKHIKHIQMLISKYISLSKCLRKVTIYHHISLSHCVYIYIHRHVYKYKYIDALSIHIYAFQTAISLSVFECSASLQQSGRGCSRDLRQARGWRSTVTWPRENPGHGWHGGQHMAIFMGV